MNLLAMKLTNLGYKQEGTIGPFKDEYSFLSNFYPCVVELGYIKYPSSEHAYQAYKYKSERSRRLIANLPTPGKAKKAGRGIGIPDDMLDDKWAEDDWIKESKNVMLKVLRAKFEQNPELTKKLLATGNCSLVEKNYWHDNFWGVCICKNCREGKNNLGKLLMQIRKELG